MQEFINLITGFPTVLFTIPLCLICIYWLLVMLGALDLDGSLEVDADGMELDSAEGEDLFANVMGLLGLSGIPFMAAMSFFIFFSWVFALIADAYLSSLIGLALPRIGVAAVEAAAASIGGLIAAALLSRPLKKLFIVHSAPSNQSLVGKICTITTLRVDEKFGQAEIKGGASLLVQVRCDSPNSLTRGSKALIINYSSDHEAFDISSFDAELESGLQSLASSQQEERPTSQDKTDGALPPHSDKEKQQ